VAESRQKNQSGVANPLHV